MTQLPRLTVAAIVPDGGRYLLVEERIDGRNLLNQPAGHVDPGESVLRAVVRETLEESGWEVRPLALVGIYQLLLPHTHYVRMAFLCEPLRQVAGASLDIEIERTHWLSAGEIARHPLPRRSPLVMRCIDDHEAGRRFPLELILEPTVVTA